MCFLKFLLDWSCQAYSAHIVGNVFIQSLQTFLLLSSIFMFLTFFIFERFYICDII